MIRDHIFVIRGSGKRFANHIFVIRGSGKRDSGFAFRDSGRESHFRDSG